MKKRISIIISMAMLLTILLPIGTFAQMDQNLQNAIKKAKSLLNISNEYENFEYAIEKVGDKVYYNLNWSDQELGYVSVSIDSNGTIDHYGKHEYHEDRVGKLPLVSEDKGLKISKDFIKKINPKIEGKVEYKGSISDSYDGSTNYYFTYARTENNIPYYGNQVTVSVDTNTGEVRSYIQYWDEKIKFSSPNKIISSAEAEKAFKENENIELLYNFYRNKGKLSPRLIYSISDSKLIDAETGKPLNDVIGGQGSYSKSGGFDSSGILYGLDSEVLYLSPEEQKNIDELKNIISDKEAENVARKLCNISNKYELKSSRLSSNEAKDNYNWMLEFYGKNQNDDFISVAIDAKTKELKRLSKYSFVDNKKDVAYSKEKALKKAKDFISSVSSEKFKQTELIDSEDPILTIQSGEDKNYYFTFARKYNGIKVSNNGFTIAISGVTGDVESYGYNWYEEKLPSSDNVTSKEKALDNILSEIKLELQYVTDIKDDIDKEKVAKLVYGLEPNKFIDVDATTGALIDFEGKPYKDKKETKTYKDINNSKFKEIIEKLAKYGVYLPGEEFKGNEEVTQKDFLYLLAKSKGYSYIDYENTDELYQHLINERIIKKNEKNRRIK
ncbi:S-layer domain-containing protein [Gottschalkia purinilytica]|uniref:S-layer domain-containing protein n=1 Tax=Gottschalkia purinilytica TaxID=1503 RepID=A0A0L0W8J2_GOTPU|nr:YcdB/YcdC domain-containing protein [Gottschalkia purinilytica]KNF07888.1 S-layer domain-containing protein [Gottschalkia purinilytica]